MHLYQLPGLLLVFTCFFIGNLKGQSDTSHLLNEIVVSTFQDQQTKETSLKMETLSQKSMEQRGGLNLTQALTEIAGVSQLSTGNAISKPVIRGLYGNRVLVLYAGMRLDNQQWQDEHGLGLGNMGIGKVEVIKGPFSLLYGSEAVGGVINIIEEDKAPVGQRIGDFKSVFRSNTLGFYNEAGIKKNSGNRWSRIRIGYESHADYFDGNNQRVLNSRFNGYYLKSTFGFHRKRWTSDNNYHFSYNQFGFVFNDLGRFLQPDNLHSRSMYGPHHKVMLHLFSSNNRIVLSGSALQVNFGVQSNFRAEDEGGGQLSLMMHLVNFQNTLKWSKNLSAKTLLVVSNVTSVENNHNFGRRKIIPDAWMEETNIATYLKRRLGHSYLEAGIGTGIRHITTQLTPTVNSAEKDIDPFTKSLPFGNAMLGISLNPNKKFNFKMNASTGVRAPNLAELSSNGLHEGIYTYEIGDPLLQNEQNLNTEIGMEYAGKTWFLSLAGYVNQFRNYIYLDPTDEQWYGFAVYRFRQANAAIHGGEAVVAYQPGFLKGLKAKTSTQICIGKMHSGDFLPYMPAISVKPEISYSKKAALGWWHSFVNDELVAAQTRLALAEKATPGYQLINGGIGLEFKVKSCLFETNIVGSNLLNKAYYNHMSRFKNYGLLNIGRDISIQLKIKFNQTLTSKNHDQKS